MRSLSKAAKETSAADKLILEGSRSRLSLTRMIPNPSGNSSSFTTAEITSVIERSSLSGSLNPMHSVSDA